MFREKKKFNLCQTNIGKKLLKTLIEYYICYYIIIWNNLKLLFNKNTEIYQKQKFK